jgi:hypothetical protein
MFVYPQWSTTKPTPPIDAGVAQVGASFSGGGPHFVHGLPQICNPAASIMTFVPQRTNLVVQGHQVRPEATAQFRVSEIQPG